MEGYNGSPPAGQQGKIRLVLCRLRASAVSGWGWGTYVLQQYRWLLFGGLTLLLAVYIQYALPQWSVYSIQFLQENLLVAITIAFLLLIFFLWKLPKSRVADFKTRKIV